MKKELKNISPLRAGIVLGTLYGFLGLIVVPIFILMTLFGPGAHPGFAVAFLLLLPVLYAVMGFIGGIISAFLYNLIAGWTGGLEFEVRDVAPATPPSSSFNPPPPP